MWIKCNRGPYHGKQFMLDTQWQDTIRVVAPENILDAVRQYGKDLPDFPQMREGEYRRSHRKLKNGTIIFEWMGWLDGKV